MNKSSLRRKGFTYPESRSTERSRGRNQEAGAVAEALEGAACKLAPHLGLLKLLCCVIGWLVGWLMDLVTATKIGEDKSDEFLFIWNISIDIWPLRS